MAQRKLDRSNAELGRDIGCSHTTVKNLIRTGEGCTWSSHLYRDLCYQLGVPVYEVLAGLDADQRFLLRALELVRQERGDAAARFVDRAVEHSQDLTGKPVPARDPESGPIEWLPAPVPGE